MNSHIWYQAMNIEDLYDRFGDDDLTDCEFQGHDWDENDWCEVCGGYAGTYCLVCGELYPYGSTEYDEAPPEEDWCPHAPGKTCKEATDEPT